jgi:hypothetical protein
VADLKAGFIDKTVLKLIRETVKLPDSDFASLKNAQLEKVVIDFYS